jgi:hypothetical protein
MRGIVLKFKDGHTKERWISDAYENIYVGYKFPRATVIEIIDDWKPRK